METPREMQRMRDIAVREVGLQVRVAREAGLVRLVQKLSSIEFMAEFCATLVKKLYVREIKHFPLIIAGGRLWRAEK